MATNVSETFEVLRTALNVPVEGEPAPSDKLAMLKVLEIYVTDTRRSADALEIIALALSKPPATT